MGVARFGPAVVPICCCQRKRDVVLNCGEESEHEWMAFAPSMRWMGCLGRRLGSRVACLALPSHVGHLPEVWRLCLRLTRRFRGPGKKL